MSVVALALSALTLHGLHAPPATVYHLQACPDGGRSCTYPGTHDIYLAPGWRRRDLYHEIGHQVDYWTATDADRQTFEQIMSDTRPWRLGANAPNERFAEAFALCGFSLKTVRRWGAGLILGGYGYWPSIHQYRQVCTLVRTIEAR